MEIIYVVYTILEVVMVSSFLLGLFLMYKIKNKKINKANGKQLYDNPDVIFNDDKSVDL